MLAAYLTCTGLAALACGYAVYLNVTRAKLIIATSQRLGLPLSMTVPCGILLGLAGAGLLIGLEAPVLGAAAACGLVAYFVIAVAAHLRARDRQVAWALVFLSLGVAALATGLAYHGPIG